jgi:hypothetical protein
MRSFHLLTADFVAIPVPALAQKPGTDGTFPGQKPGTRNRGQTGRSLVLLNERTQKMGYVPSVPGLSRKPIPMKSRKLSS